MKEKNNAIKKTARIITTMILCCVCTKSAEAFVHPGCLSTQADLDRMAAKVAACEQPWKSSWDILVANYHAQLSYTPNPQTSICAGGVCHPENYMTLAHDCAAAYQCALRYHISGDTAYADKAVEIMNAWAYTLEEITGDTNASLRAGLYGYQFACAGELMRGYSGWSSADFTQFKNMMLNIFYAANTYFLTYHHGTCNSHYWANWDLANMASIMAIGVLCDDQAVFDEALNYFYNGVGEGAIGNAVHYIHPDGSGQWQESGRDQGHNTLGMVLMGPICEIAWNQGIDLYGHAENRFLAGCEYVAKYNLWNDVPYVTYINCEYTIQPDISSSSRGNTRAGWDMIYNHYVNRMGLAAPYTANYAAMVRPEGGGGNYGSSSGGYDSLGFTTLTHTLDPIASGAVPGALLPYIKGRQITLSWAGSAYATSYNVKRSTTSGGPYNMFAMVKDTYYIDPGLTAGTTYYYVVSANNPDSESANSAQVAATADGQLHGTVIGTDGSWNSAGATKYTVFDGSLKNYFDGPSSVSWACLDLGLGVSAVITQVKYCPRPYFSGRMVGGRFQGSNTADFSSGVTNLFTISTQPPYGVLTSQTISNPGSFRYVRYLSPTGGYGNVAEVQFLGNISGLNVPVAPTDLWAEVISSLRADLHWNASSGSTSYYLKRATISGGPYTIITNGAFTSFADTGLTGSKTYYYVVSALNSAGQSTKSSEVTVTTPIRLVNIALGCTASASDDNLEWNPAEVAASAFDGSTATKWYTGGDTGYAGWLQADLGAGNAQMVVRYDIGSANDEPERDPKDWQLLASNDGSNWTTLDTCSGELFANRYQTNQYTISNSTAYRYYRLNITSNFSGSAADGIQLSELALMVQVPTFSSGLINNLDSVESRDYIGNSLSNYVTAPGGTFSKTSGPDWLVMAPNGMLSGVPLNSDVGENIFTVRVEGPEGLFDTATMTIRVANTYSGTQGMVDLAGLAAQWLVTGCVDTPPCDGADLDGDANVDFLDFAELADNWQIGL